MAFYQFLRPLWPSMIKCLLSRAGLLAGPLFSTPLQINSQPIPRLDPIDSKSSYFFKQSGLMRWSRSLNWIPTNHCIIVLLLIRDSVSGFSTPHSTWDNRPGDRSDAGDRLVLSPVCPHSPLIITAIPAHTARKMLAKGTSLLSTEHLLE